MSKTTRPGIYFFYGDWRSDVQLMSCSLESQAVWLHAICIMNRVKRKGYLAHPNGSPMSYEDMSTLFGVDAKTVERCMTELLDKEAASIDNGVIYCRKIAHENNVSKSRSKSARSRWDMQKSKQHAPDLHMQKHMQTGEGKGNKGEIDDDGDGGTPRVTQMTPYADIWLEVTGGIFPHCERMAKVHKKLRKHYAEDQIQSHWRNYCEKKDSEYATPEDFGKTFMKWGDASEEEPQWGKVS